MSDEELTWSNTVLRAARDGHLQAIRDTLLLAAGEIRAGRPIVEPELAAYIADGLTRAATGKVDPFGARLRTGERPWFDPRSTGGRDIQIALHILWNMSRGTSELESIEFAADQAGVSSPVAKKALNEHRRFIGDGRLFASAREAPDLSIYRTTLRGREQQ